MSPQAVRPDESYEQKYADQVVHDGAVGYWKLHGETDLADSSGAVPVHDGHDGAGDQDPNGQHTKVSTVDGVWQGSHAMKRDRDGATDPGIGFENASIVSGSDVTYEGWKLGDCHYGAIANQSESGENERYLRNAGVGEMHGSGGGTDPDLVSTNGVGWTYWVLTVDDSSNGATVKLYNDGQVVDSRNGVSVPDDWDALTIAQDRSADCSGAAFSDIAVYDKALSLSQIQAHFRSAGFVNPISEPELLGGTNPSEFCLSCALGHKDAIHGRPIDAQTGNFYHSFVDIAVPGRGPEVGIQRTYNSGGGYSEFGDGWSWNYGAYLDFGVDEGEGSTSATYVQENGSEVYFTRDGDSWVAPTNVFATLVDNHDGTWTVKRAGSETFTFTSQDEGSWARLTAIEDRNGYTTTLNWPTSLPGDLTVNGASGQVLTVHIDENDRVVWSVDGLGRTVNYGYDSSFERVVSATSLAGGSWSYGYDAGGLMTSMTEPSTDSLERTTKNAYDSSGRAVDQWDPVAIAGGHGSDTSFATRFDYSVPGTTTVTDPDGVVHNQVFQDGYLISDTVGQGSGAGTTTYEYDGLTSGGSKVTDPSGNVVSTEFTSQGWTKSVTDGENHTTSYDDFDSFGNPWKVTTPDGVETSYVYDSHGNLTSSSTPWDTHSGQGVGSTYTYSDAAHPEDAKAVMGSNGLSSNIDYVASTGRVKQVEDQAHGVTTYGYNALGAQTWQVAPNGNVSGGDVAAHRQIELVNLKGQPIASMGATGVGVVDGFVRHGSTSLGVADTGETWQVPSGGGTWQVSDYGAYVTALGANGRAVAQLPTQGNPDVMGASMVVQAPNANGPGIAFRFQDANNYWVLWQLPAYGGVVLSKNVNGVFTTVAGFATGLATGDRLTIATAATGGMLFYHNETLIGSYTDTVGASATGVGLYSSVVGPVSTGFIAGRQGLTLRWFNAAGQIVKQAGPTTNGPFLLSVTKYAYDLDGRATSVVDGNNVSTSSAWTAGGRLSSQTDGNNQVTSYGYDSLGRLAWKQLPGQTDQTRESYGYTWGSTSTSATVTTTFASASSPRPTVTSTLNRNGEPTLVDYSDGTPDVTVTYDVFGRAKTESAGGVSVVKNWDSLGQLKDVTRDGRMVSYTYDFPGELHQITYPGAGHVVTRSYDAYRRWTGVADWAGGSTEFTYDADGNVTSVKSPNTSGGVVDTRVFDGDGAISSIDVSNSSGSLASWVYSRNPDEGLSGVNETGVGTSKTWSHDAANQLTAQSAGPAQSYGFDPGGNPVTLAGQAQAFNERGELCWSATVGVAGSSRDCGIPPAGSTGYTYNDRGQRSAAGSSIYSWDLAGSLSGASTPSGVSSYVYDPDGLRVSKTVGGVTTDFSWDDTTGVAQLLQDGDDCYVYGPDGLPVERIGADPSVYLHEDATGSVRLTTKPDGAVDSSVSYTPWGTVESSTGTPVSLGWQSQYQDPETGFYYLQARYYDPATAQFLTPDPLYAITGDRYGYAGNDPVNGSDPTGQCFFCVAVVIFTIFEACEEGPCEEAAAFFEEEGGLGAEAEIEMSEAAGGIEGGPPCAELGPSQDAGGLSEAPPATPVEVPTPSEQRAINSLQRQIAEHESKLRAYEADPDAYDNQGRLHNASPTVRKRIIEGRIAHLQREIDAFRGQINRIRRGE